MMRLLSKKNNQCGAYLPLMALGIIALLGVAALSIDAANMFYTNLQYKKATDAGVVAGLEYRVKKGFQASLHTAFDQYGFEVANASLVTEPLGLGPMQKSVIQRAREVARNNVLFSIPKFQGLLDETDVYVQFEGPTAANNNTEGLQVEFRDLQRDNLLMTTGLNQLLGGTGNKDSFKTSGLSTGAISPVQIVLMIDLSNSMMCPVSYTYYQDPLLKADCADAMGKRQRIQRGTNTEITEFPLIGRKLGEPEPGNLADEIYHNDVKFEINRTCYCGCLITDTTSCPNKYNQVAPNTTTGNYIVNTINPDPNLSSKFSLDNKMSHLIQGVDAFMERFRPFKDNIAIIPFNSSSFVYKSINTPFSNLAPNNLVGDWDVGQQIAGDPDEDREVHDQAKLNTIFQNIVQQTGNLKLGDWTNPSDALLSGYIHNLHYNSDDNGNVRVKTHYVLFTDGAPSATRILLDDPTLPGVSFLNQAIHSEVMSKLGSLPLDNDVTLLSILSSYQQYSSLGTSPKVDSSGSVWAPSPFIKSQLLIEENPDPFGTPSNPSILYGLQVDDTKTAAYNSLLFPGAGIPDPENISTYGNFWSPGALTDSIDIVDLKGNIFKFNNTMSGPNIKFIQPIDIYEANITSDKTTLDCIPPSGSGKKIFTNKYSTSLPVSPPPDCLSTISTLDDEWMKIFYNVPIYYADIMRQNNGTVHTIGFGEADPCQPQFVSGSFTATSGCVMDPSPYQNYLDAISRKDFLLGRIAGRTDIVINQVNQLGVSSKKALVVPAFDNTKSTDSKLQGTYSAADENFSIVKAFEKIADDIVRLSR